VWMHEVRGVIYSSRTHATVSTAEAWREWIRRFGGKFFSRLVTKAGLSDPALVLHSLWHGGLTKLYWESVWHARNKREEQDITDLSHPLILRPARHHRTL
jgi:hypothetical protein